MLVAGYLVLKAKTLREYGDSFYSSFALIVSGVICLSQVLNIGHVLKFIQNIDGFVCRSESKYLSQYVIRKQTFKFKESS